MTHSGAKHGILKAGRRRRLWEQGKIQRSGSGASACKSVHGEGHGNQISFTLAFKEAFWRLSVEGCTGNMALRKLGYDPELLGFERVHNITKRIRRAGKSPEGIRPAPKSRMRISREQFGAAELEKCPAERVSAGCSRKSCIFSSRWRS